VQDKSHAREDESEPEEHPGGVRALVATAESGQYTGGKGREREGYKTKCAKYNFGGISDSSTASASSNPHDLKWLQ